MERHLNCRRSEFVQLSLRQKPHRIPTENDSIGEGIIYPYAWSQTYDFLTAAIAEQAHRILPFPLRDYSDGEDRWIRKLNMLGIYFSSPAVEEDIGRLYGYGRRSKSLTPNLRQGPHAQIKDAISYLWGNCSKQLQDRFPLEQIPIDKPLSAQSRDKMSIGVSLRKGGVMFRVIPRLHMGGVSLIQIAKEEQVSYCVVKAIVSKERKKKRIPNARWNRNSGSIETMQYLQENPLRPNI